MSEEQIPMAAQAETQADAAPAKKMDDLANLNTRSGANEGATMTVKHPTEGRPLYNDDGSAMTITGLGIDSDKYRKAEHAAINTRLSMGGRRGAPAKLSAQQLDASSLTQLVAVVTSWNITLGGAKPECNEVNVRRAFEEYPWLKEQWDEFIADRGNFMKASASN